MLFLGLIFTINMNAQEAIKDIVHLKDGSKIVCQVVKFDESYVEIKISGSNTMKIERSQIQKIEYSIDTSLKEEALKTKAEFGGTLGTPAGLNLVYNNHFDNFILQLSGLYLGPIRGIQLGFCWKVSESENNYHAFGGAIGSSYFEEEKEDYYYSYTEINKWTYVAAVYNFNYNGFYLQPGLSFGEGTFSNPQLLIQIGYVYKFK